MGSYLKLIDWFKIRWFSAGFFGLFICHSSCLWFWLMVDMRQNRLLDVAPSMKLRQHTNRNAALPMNKTAKPSITKSALREWRRRVTLFMFKNVPQRMKESAPLTTKGSAPPIPSNNAPRLMNKNALQSMIGNAPRLMISSARHLMNSSAPQFMNRNVELTMNSSALHLMSRSVRQSTSRNALLQDTENRNVTKFLSSRAIKFLGSRVLKCPESLASKYRRRSAMIRQGKAANKSPRSSVIKYQGRTVSGCQERIVTRSR